jgi:hypothetical protein
MAGNLATPQGRRQSTRGPSPLPDKRTVMSRPGSRLHLADWARRMPVSGLRGSRAGPADRVAVVADEPLDTAGHGHVIRGQGATVPRSERHSDALAAALKSSRWRISSMRFPSPCQPGREWRSAVSLMVAMVASFASPRRSLWLSMSCGGLTIFWYTLAGCAVSEVILHGAMVTRGHKGGIYGSTVDGHRRAR